jgi:hypothetical protein
MLFIEIRDDFIFAITSKTRMYWEERNVFRRFRKIAKSNYVFALSSLSVRPHETTRIPLDGCLQHLIIFRKSVEKIQDSLICDKNNRYFTSPTAAMTAYGQL